MGPKYKGMTAYDHVQNGRAVVEIKTTLHGLLSECGSKFGKSNAATKSVQRTLDSLVRLQSALDDEYCKVATREDITQYRYPYYAQGTRS